MTYDELQRIAATKRLHPGDTVQVNGSPCEVIDTSDPALITLQTQNGAKLRIGRARLGKSST